MRPITPLRYPGSKANLADYFEGFLRDSLLWGVDIVEPFAGSAALSMALLRRGVVSKAFLIERDPLLYSFWLQLKRDPVALVRRLNRQEVTVGSWARMQRYLQVERPDPSLTLELAVACVFLNRTNFSGILHAKPIGGIGQRSSYAIDCRFNKEGVTQALLATAELMPKVTIAFGDGVRYLQRNRSRIASQARVVYADPPYYGQGRKLYRYHYRDKDHMRLARVLNESPFRWVASYDNHSYVRNLFSRHTIVPIFLNYVVKQSRRAEELLISNVRLPPVRYHGEMHAEICDEGRRVAPGSSAHTRLSQQVVQR